MEKLEREEQESKAYKWKRDFQELRQTYNVAGCNKATV